MRASRTILASDVIAVTPGCGVRLVVNSPMKGKTVAFTRLQHINFWGAL